MKDKQVLIRLPQELHKKLAHSAVEEGVSRCYLIVSAIEKYLGKETKKERRMKTFLQSVSDVRRAVSNQLENYDLSCYRLPYDELLEQVTDDLIEFLKGLHFQWGDEMPETSDEDWENLFKPYEK